MLQYEHKIKHSNLQCISEGILFDADATGRSGDEMMDKLL